MAPGGTMSNQAEACEAARITVAWAVREVTDPIVRTHLEDALSLTVSARDHARLIEPTEVPT